VCLQEVQVLLQAAVLLRSRLQQALQLAQRHAAILHASAASISKHQQTRNHTWLSTLYSPMLQQTSSTSSALPQYESA
jgi:hypothetical protein